MKSIQPVYFCFSESVADPFTCCGKTVYRSITYCVTVGPRTWNDLLLIWFRKRNAKRNWTSSVLSQLWELNDFRVDPWILPDMILIDLETINGRSVIGSGSSDKLRRIGRVSRYSSILFMEGQGHGNVAYEYVFMESQTASLQFKNLRGRKFIRPLHSRKKDMLSLSGNTQSLENLCTAIWKASLVSEKPLSLNSSWQIKPSFK